MFKSTELGGMGFTFPCWREEVEKQDPTQVWEPDGTVWVLLLR